MRLRFPDRCVICPCGAGVVLTAAVSWLVPPLAQRSAAPFSNQWNSIVGTPQTVQRKGWIPSNPAQRIDNLCRLSPIAPKDLVHLQNGGAARRALEQLRHQVVGGNIEINFVENLCFLRRS